MPENLLNGRTLAGVGLGSVTGLGINRLMLGNKSLLSNILAASAGGLAGGTLGYYLDKALKPEKGSLRAAAANAEFNEEGREKTIAQRDKGAIDVLAKKLNSGKPLTEADRETRDLLETAYGKNLITDILNAKNPAYQANKYKLEHGGSDPLAWLSDVVDKTAGPDNVDKATAWVNKWKELARKNAESSKDRIKDDLELVAGVGGDLKETVFGGDESTGSEPVKSVVPPTVGGAVWLLSNAKKKKSLAKDLEKGRVSTNTGVSAPTTEDRKIQARIVPGEPTRITTDNGSLVGISQLSPTQLLDLKDQESRINSGSKETVKVTAGTDPTTRQTTVYFGGKPVDTKELENHPNIKKVYDEYVKSLSPTERDQRVYLTVNENGTYTITGDDGKRKEPVSLDKSREADKKLRTAVAKQLKAIKNGTIEYKPLSVSRGGLGQDVVVRRGGEILPADHPSLQDVRGLISGGVMQLDDMQRHSGGTGGGKRKGGANSKASVEVGAVPVKVPHPLTGKGVQIGTRKITTYPDSPKDGVVLGTAKVPVAHAAETVPLGVISVNGETKPVFYSIPPGSRTPVFNVGGKEMGYFDLPKTVRKQVAKVLASDRLIDTRVLRLGESGTPAAKIGKAVVKDLSKAGKVKHYAKHTAKSPLTHAIIGWLASRLGIQGGNALYQDISGMVRNSARARALKQEMDRKLRAK